MAAIGPVAYCAELPASAATKINWTEKQIEKVGQYINACYLSVLFGREELSEIRECCKGDNFIIDVSIGPKAQLVSAKIHGLDIPGINEFEGYDANVAPMLIIRFNMKKISEEDYEYSLSFLDKQKQEIDDKTLFHDRNHLELVDLRTQLMEAIRKKWWSDGGATEIDEDLAQKIAEKVNSLHKEALVRNQPESDKPATFWNWIYVDGICTGEIVGWKGHFSDHVWKKPLEENPKQKDAYFKILVQTPTSIEGSPKIYGLCGKADFDERREEILKALSL